MVLFHIVFPFFSSVIGIGDIFIMVLALTFNFLSDGVLQIIDRLFSAKTSTCPLLAGFGIAGIYQINRL
jgi:hypothetical protein